jgi:hypothetical protein
MKTLTKTILSILLVIFISSCKEKPVTPVVLTTPLSDTSTTTAVSGGTITDDGGAAIISEGVCWNTSDNPTIDNFKTTDTGSGSFVSYLTGLSPATVYYIRAYATNNEGTGYGKSLSFKTFGDKPSADSLTVSNIKITSAALSGSVNSNSLSTTVSFEWGTSTDYGNTVSAIQSPVSNDNPVHISADLTDLLRNTTYHIRIKAENSLGVSYSDDLSFCTPEVDWAASSDFPGAARRMPLSFTYNGKGYYGLGRNSINPSNENLKDFWTYDPATSVWTRLNDCPYTFTTGLTARCLLGSTLYVFKEWALYSYDITTDSWAFILNTSNSLLSTSCFTINGRAFFFNTSNSELYEYIPDSTAFYKKNALISGYSDFGLGQTFVINNEAYLIHKNDTKIEIYHYISSSDAWEKKVEKEFSNQAFTSASFLITIGNSAFIGQSTSFTVSSQDDNATVVPELVSSNVWKYDYLKNEFTQSTSLPGDFRSHSGCFSFDNNGYIIGGATIDSNTQKFKYLNDVIILNP